MRKAIEMPKFGYDMENGKIAGWTVKEGDKVERGDVIAEIETEKSTVEMEATASGKLVEIVRQASDEDVSVGEVIGYIDDEA